ncbi:hypothetical protein [Sphingomonas sp. S2-65]|uniref:hypothetical protein n=1 Tax=Sphingomonas sp. S2-65 TaxID=2903960 RepID=UPI001F33A5CE|nr:hypothetical protein [Sphingomonas sp. S2-65]UYY58566.1 hypothetical protein LZ586_00125 [Sphingomonas sp. S2-65]
MTKAIGRARNQSLRAIFAIPLLLAMLSVVGLVVALVDQGWPDLVSWVLLSAPIAAVAWAMRARRR